MATAPDNLDAIRKHVQRGLDVMESRREGYITGQEMYDGSRSEIAASKAIRKLIDRNDGGKHTLSIAHVPVDALFDRVELQGIAATDKASSDALTAALDANDFEEESDDWQHRAGYFGDYYIVASPSADNPVDGTIAPEDIDIVGRSPLDTIVIYDDATGRKPQYGVTRWREGKAWRAFVYYDDVTVQLVTDEGDGSDAPPKAVQFEYDVDITGDEASARLAHPGGKLLVTHIAIDSRPYGTPVHLKAFGPQESITKINAVNLINVDGQGLGARWALEDPGKEIDDDIDDDFGTNGPDTTTANDDGRTTATRKSVRSVPGEIALLKGIKSVGQFNAANSSEFTSNLEWYIRIAAVITGTPLFEFDLNGEQPSGEARRRAEGRINKHARKVQRALGRAYENLAEVVLALTGHESDVAASFTPVEVSSDKDGFELIAQKVAVGVPIAQAFREGGYTSEQVDEWFPKGDPNVNLTSLTTIASALQQLGQAKVLGVINDEEIRALLPDVITAAVNEGAAVIDPNAEPVDPEAAPVDPNAAPSGDQIEAQNAETVKAKADALGILIRAGADPLQAAALLGLDDLTFPNVPVTVRLPESDASKLEGSVPAPTAPTGPSGS